MNKHFFFPVLIALIATGCALDDTNVCSKDDCECFIDNDGTPVLSSCTQYIPEHAHATGCSGSNKCVFECDEDYVQSEFENTVTCIREDIGCNPNRFPSPICRENNLSKCDQDTGLWKTLFQCSEGCSEDHCQNTCNEDEIGNNRCLEGNKFQTCTHNDYENIWKISNECKFGCDPQTNQCNERVECKKGLADNAKDCIPWIESSDESIEIDITLDKIITLYYFGKNGTLEAGRTFTLDVSTENCIELSRDTLKSSDTGTELTIKALNTTCNTKLIISADNVQNALSIPVTVREPKDDNHNNMFDVLELASKQNEPCRTDEDCAGDIPGFCDSFIGFKCSTPCNENSCIGDQFYCRSDRRCAAKAFETIWEIPEDDKTLVLPTQYATECNFDIDWGDGKTNSFPTCPGENIEHQYAKAGQYYIKITGTYDNWAFVKKEYPNTDFCKHFKGVISFGPVGLAGKGYWVFYNCKNYDHTAPTSDIPDATKLTNMAYMFMGNTKFNQDISNWDTSNVTNLSHAFENASAFNQPIGNWNTSKVTTINYAFRNATEFNQDLNGWDTANVEHMQEVFSFTSSFNGKISKWNTSKVENMSKMFLNAKSFNQDLNEWDVSNVTTMSAMFSGTTAFNGKITDWKPEKVTNMSDMFNGAEAFNQPLEWDLKQVSTMSKMFANTKAFNQALIFTFGTNCSFKSMFSGAEKFNHESINNWDVSKGIDFRYMFKDTKAFNQPLANWRPEDNSMDGMFQGAESFNQNISSWNPKHAKNIGHFFDGAKNYNQPLDWNFNSVASDSNVLDMFKDTKLSKENYCTTVKDKNIEKYANALGVDYKPADCPN